MKLNGNFTIIPNEFINDSRLDVYEFRILCYLMKLSGCNSSCYPYYETIARETGMSLKCLSSQYRKTLRKASRNQLSTPKKEQKNTDVIMAWEYICKSIKGR
jgi:hypothetical protein